MLKDNKQAKNLFSHTVVSSLLYFIYSKTRIPAQNSRMPRLFSLYFSFFVCLTRPRTNRTATFFHSSTCINNSLPDMPFCALPPYLAMRSGCYTVRCKRPFKVGCHCLAISGYIVARSLNPDKTFLPAQYGQPVPLMVRAPIIA